MSGPCLCMYANVVHSPGPISSVTVFGQTIILLHDAQVAIDLLEKRSAKHSSRPPMVFSGEMYATVSSTEHILWPNFV